jgi:hypothetical protein
MDIQKLIANSNQDYFKSVLEQRTTKPVGSKFDCSPSDLLAAILAANWSAVSEPGVSAPAQAFVANLPMEGTVGVVRYGDLSIEAQEAVQWLDPKGTAGTQLGGALPCVEHKYARMVMPRTSRVIILAGPKDDGEGLEVWTLFPQPKGMRTPEPQPQGLTEDSMIKVIW